jgi:hypothetical protein
MTNHDKSGSLRRLLTTIGATLKRALLGKSAHEHMKQFTGNDTYWENVLASQSGWPLKKLPKA